MNVIRTEDVVEEFKDSLRHTLELAERISTLGMQRDYASAVKNFVDYGTLIELVFRNPNVLVNEMLYFGRRGGKIGVPVIEEFREEGEIEDEG